MVRWPFVERLFRVPLRSFDDGPRGRLLRHERGDQVWLIQADTSGRPLRFVDHAEFGPAERGVSIGPGPEPDGRWLPLAEQTFGDENAGTRIGDVIITEVHYAPRDPDGERRQFKADQFEFVELYNRTGETVDISGWRLAGGVEMTFPPGSVLEPNSLLLAVPFDPGDSVASSIFRITLGVDSAVPLAGPYIGLLADDGDQVRLEKPLPRPPQDPGFAPFMYVDEVSYDSVSPWPDGIVGTGDSLSRRTSTSFGNFPSTWTRRAASPGMVDFVLRRAGDANEDREFDQRDIVSVLQAGKYLTGRPAVWSEGDWTGDGLFNQADVVAALQTGNYLTSP